MITTEKARVVEGFPKEKHYFPIARLPGQDWFTIGLICINPKNGQIVKERAEEDWKGYEVKILEVDL